MDFYGNGRQPNSFDVITVNAHHIHSIMDIPKSVFYRLFARRVKKPRQMRLSGLFDKIPEIKDDKRLEGPKRKKWDGEIAMGVFGTIFFSSTRLRTCSNDADSELVMAAKWQT